MKILYDGFIFDNQQTGGISRYFSNLINHLPLSCYPTITTSSIDNFYIPKHSNLKKFYFKRYGFRPGRLSYWLEKFYFRAVEDFCNFDLAHPTYYSSLTRQLTHHSNRPLITTVHDMIHEIFAEQMDPARENSEIKRRRILSSQAIICVSENTKKDLLEFLPVSEEKITVTYLASEVSIEMSYGMEEVPCRPYYLFVGDRAIYKNFKGLIEAFSKVITINSELILCVAGKPFTNDELRQIYEFNLQEFIINYAHVTDDHLAKLYRCCEAFIYPSHYEGFGIPPLEAMSCGAVVIASNNSSIPEVVGDAGLMFDSRSTDDLVDKLVFITTNPLEREKFIQKGLQRATNFSWKKTALQTMNVYLSVSS